MATRKASHNSPPRMEDGWLVLVAYEPNPQAAWQHAMKAREIHPESPLARRTVEWATSHRSKKLNQTKRNRKQWWYPVLLVGIACLLLAVLVLFIFTSPALGSYASRVSIPVSTQENLWAPVSIAKPSITPLDVRVFAPSSQNTPERAPAGITTAVLTNPSTFAETETPTLNLQATETPPALTMEIVEEDTTDQLTSGANPQESYPLASSGERWIDVNLSEQRVYAYEGDVVVNSFIVSTGVAETPTVTGDYRIYVKVQIQDMSGPGYYLRDVPWVMYFFEGYGFHGTYWHNNFGTPMSRGCVNMKIDDAAWLYDWASVGTLVNIHY